MQIDNSVMERKPLSMKVEPAAKSVIDARNIVDKFQSWPEPEPLNKEEIALDYPLDCLPLIIREAVMEVQQFAQAPFAMVAMSALATLSIAAQAYFNVQRT